MTSNEMDFSCVKKEAESFLSSSPTSLVITNVNEEKREIHLSSQDNGIILYVSCPCSENSSWNIWSDDEKSLRALQYVMDMCSLDTCTNISDVLEMLSKSLLAAARLKDLRESSPAAGGEDEDNYDNDGNDDGDEDDDDVEDYYADEDFDAQDNELTSKCEEKESEEQVAANFFNSTGSNMAVKRLVKDLKALSNESQKFGISASPKGNNLFVWDVKLTDIPPTTKLGRDLAEYAKRYKTEPVITLDMQFPSDYPFSPPFIRVLTPRFKFLTGHVTIGGSICMQMLTKSGWCPANDIESILIQVRTEILADPNASLDFFQATTEYTETEARAAFQRMVQKYGW